MQESYFYNLLQLFRKFICVFPLLSLTFNFNLSTLISDKLIS
jgi:hypothetical protein